MRKYFTGDEAKVVVDVAGRGLTEFDGVLTGGNVDIDAHDYQVKKKLSDQRFIAENWSREVL